MKTKIFRTTLLLLMPTLLSAQNGVTVSNLAVNSGTVTFSVSWDRNSEALQKIVWLDSVWVFVDYNDNGVMRRLPLSEGATLTATSAPGVGGIIQYSDNNKGVWVVGNAKDVNNNSSGSFSATVQLLTTINDVAGACAYASNYPPVGQYTGVNRIKFTGTPSFDLQLNRGNSTLDREGAQGLYDAPEGKYMVAFTDATGAPGRIVFDSPCAGVQGEIGKGEKDGSCTGTPGSIGVTVAGACAGNPGSIGVAAADVCISSPGLIGY
jgi:hypothetical protein